MAMSQKELILRIGGAAGDGGSSTAESFAKICTRSGLYAFTYTSYQSVIRGGHMWVQVRASEEPLLSQGERPHVLICLNQPTADIHVPQVREGGAVIFDSESVKVEKDRLPDAVRVLAFPLARMARQYGNNPLMKNTVALGAAIRLFDMDLKVVEGAFRRIWGNKKEEVVQANVKAATAGYGHPDGHGGSLNLGLTYSNKPRILITGNQAIALGALAAGCKFLAQYPMTPASSIMHWMADHAPEHGVVVKQVEDELAAVNMAIGAGFAGARAMTATSGGGFSLMVEGLGQGGMVEAPVVVVLAQRAGPSTGVPTKTEQGDLNLALGAGQGDWPRAVIAPRNTQECFRLTTEAFNLADVYQTPIIVMSDLYLSEGYRTVDGFDFNVPIIRGLLAADGGEAASRYLRYKITDSGVSPRALPGQKGFQFDAGSDEHDEKGELISDVLAGIPEYVELRRRMMEKRMRKLQGLLRDTKGPELWGPDNADLTVISWGSTQGPVREAIMNLEESDGLSVNSLEYAYLFPFHGEETLDLLRGAKKTLAVEGNYTGQLTRLLTAETAYKPDAFFGKYDGEPFYPSEISAKIREVMT
ncbi:MAG TPA: 2-oxoacid:acceptor oxidoreductase subunit alpha [Thermoplasmata archaeon]|nr:2-oxoacid:acceptor oxidoreductase subunit alpha [Thermoplasmata archaeon]